MFHCRLCTYAQYRICVTDTRWGSVYKMMLKYVALCEATNHFRDCSFKAATRNLVPSYRLSVLMMMSLLSTKLFLRWSPY